MASDEETVPADIPSRICEICEATMTHLSDLQPRLFGAALRVFRCYACNHVVSEEW
jgi:hypothetical protein